jgi:hypothetical protein
MTTRERVSVDLDTEVTAILRTHAAEADATEGEIIDRAVRAYADLQHRSHAHAASRIGSATPCRYDPVPDESASSVEAPRSSSSVSR